MERSKHQPRKPSKTVVTSATAKPVVVKFDPASRDALPKTARNANAGRG
ncbi:MAG: hypothetical protein KDC46_07310 [Thermoleophilia bacterium]|nr:hypothetical protein [Thermoleophilia bacterium]